MYNRSSWQIVRDIGWCTVRLLPRLELPRYRKFLPLLPVLEVSVTSRVRKTTSYLRSPLEAEEEKETCQVWQNEKGCPGVETVCILERDAPSTVTPRG